MPAYLHVEIEITDPVAFEEYRRQVPALIAAHRGRYLVRGGSPQVLEGPSERMRQVIVEFPDMAHLKAFYESPDYVPLKALRQRSSRGTLVALAGVTP